MQKYILGVAAVVSVLSRVALAFVKYIPGYCGDFTGEFVFAQDVSLSFRHRHRAVFLSQMEYLLKWLVLDFPDSRFSLVTFTDKPIPDRGSVEDWCYKLVQGLTTDVDAIFETLNSVDVETVRALGGDIDESQLDALKYSLIDPNVGWSKDKIRGGREILRVVIISTTDHFHVHGDAANLPDAEYAAELLAEGIVVPAAFCLDEDYPTVDELASLLSEYNAIPVFLCGEFVDLERYWKLVDDLGAGGTVQRVGNGFENIGDVTFEALKDVTCEVISKRTTTTSTSTTKSTVTSTVTITSTTTTTTTTTTYSLPAGAVVGAAVGLVVLIGAAAAGGVFYYNRNSSPYTQDGVLGEPDMETSEMVRGDDSDFV